MSLTGSYQQSATATVNKKLLKWGRSSETKRTVCNLPCIQTSTTKCYWYRQLCNGRAVGSTLGFLLLETFLRKKKPDWMDCAKRWKATAVTSHRATKRIHALWEKAFAYGFLLTHRNTVTLCSHHALPPPPPTNHPTVYLLPLSPSLFLCITTASLSTLS